MKKCSKCNEDKEDSRFAFKKNKSGSYSVRSMCKDCTNVRQKERRKEEDVTTRDSRLLKHKEWMRSNKEKVKSLKKKYRAAKKITKLSKIIHESHVKCRDKYIKRISSMMFDQHVKAFKNDSRAFAAWRQIHDMDYVAFQRLKGRVSKFFARHKVSDTEGWFGVLGYSTSELRKHIESQFKDGMTWDNRDKWHIDHIKPLMIYSVTSIHDASFIECFGLDNMQPLWAEHNRAKYHISDKHLDKFMSLTSDIFARG